MDYPTTLKTLIEEHPEWADLPIAVDRSDGSLDYVGASGTAYAAEDDEGPVLIISGNKLLTFGH